MKTKYSIFIYDLNGKFNAILSIKGKTEWIDIKRALNHAQEYFNKTENVIVKVKSIN